HGLSLDNFILDSTGRCRLQEAAISGSGASGQLSPLRWLPPEYSGTGLATDYEKTVAYAIGVALLNVLDVFDDEGEDSSSEARQRQQETELGPRSLDPVLYSILESLCHDRADRRPALATVRDWSSELEAQCPGGGYRHVLVTMFARLHGQRKGRQRLQQLKPQPPPLPARSAKESKLLKSQQQQQQQQQQPPPPPQRRPPPQPPQPRDLLPPAFTSQLTHFKPIDARPDDENSNATTSTVAAAAAMSAAAEAASKQQLAERLRSLARENRRWALDGRLCLESMEADSTSTDWGQHKHLADSYRLLTPLAVDETADTDMNISSVGYDDDPGGARFLPTAAAESTASTRHLARYRARQSVPPRAVTERFPDLYWSDELLRACFGIVNAGREQPLPPPPLPPPPPLSRSPSSNLHLRLNNPLPTTATAREVVVGVGIFERRSRSSNTAAAAATAVGSNSKRRRQRRDLAALTARMEYLEASCRQAEALFADNQGLPLSLCQSLAGCLRGGHLQLEVAAKLDDDASQQFSLSESNNSNVTFKRGLDLAKVITNVMRNTFPKCLEPDTVESLILHRGLNLLLFWLFGFYQIDFQERKEAQTTLKSFMEFLSDQAPKLADQYPSMNGIFSLFSDCQRGIHVDLHYCDVDISSTAPYAKTQTIIPRPVSFLPWPQLHVFSPDRVSERQARQLLAESLTKPATDRPLSLLDCAESDLAASLCALSRQRFLACHPVDFLTGSGAGLADYLGHCDRLSRWCTAELLAAGSGAKQRALMARRLWLTAGECADRGDLASAVALAEGLSGPRLQWAPGLHRLDSRASRARKRLSVLRARLLSEPLSEPASVPHPRMLRAHLQSLEVGSFHLASGHIKWDKVRRLAVCLQPLRMARQAGGGVDDRRLTRQLSRRIDELAGADLDLLLQMQSADSASGVVSGLTAPVAHDRGCCRRIADFASSSPPPPTLPPPMGMLFPSSSSSTSGCCSPASLCVFRCFERCRCSSSDRVNRLPQNSQLHTNGLSPVCQRSRGCGSCAGSACAAAPPPPGPDGRPRDSSDSRRWPGRGSAGSTCRRCSGCRCRRLCCRSWTTLLAAAVAAASAAAAAAAAAVHRRTTLKCQHSQPPPQPQLPAAAAVADGASGLVGTPTLPTRVPCEIIAVSWGDPSPRQSAASSRWRRIDGSSADPTSCLNM
uniref:Ras-GEF domain-containing protein n=1 Tax=Macrostomum lignano TaxID=282301 RepID=A0A1I8FTY8_9PLAT